LHRQTLGVKIKIAKIPKIKFEICACVLFHYSLSMSFGLIVEFNLKNYLKTNFYDSKINVKFFYTKH